jgi:predicted DNA-binding transcriptional regulator AlpA
MVGRGDQWLQLPEIAKMFGLSEESIRRLAKAQGFPLRRLTPYATPGVLESELISWLKAQPQVGAPVRGKRMTKTNRSSAKR